jgi:hypothetical protein
MSAAPLAPTSSVADAVSDDSISERLAVWRSAEVCC